VREITYDFARTLVNSVDQAIPDSVADIHQRLPAPYQTAFPYILDLWKRLNFVNLRPFADYLCNTLVLGAVGADLIRDAGFGASVLDMGCGWGGFTTILVERGYKVSSLDYVFEHAVVTKFVSPDVAVYQADARDLTGLADESFDCVCMKDLIEHIGDYNEPSGRSGRNIHHQYLALKEAARVAKTGGRMMVMTGNYCSPLDGEVQRWFFHWLPEKTRQRYMQTCHFSADHYYLLTWDEISFLFQATGLAIDNVEFLGKENWQEQLIDGLDQGFHMPSIEPEYKEILRDLMMNDPHYFHAWGVALRKTARNPSMPLHDLPLALRVLGGQTNSIGQGLKAMVSLIEALSLANAKNKI